ncbi:hypothetical protein Tco_0352156 [Tanacetum coccineum]
MFSTQQYTESDEFIKSSVENLVQNPSESEDECECDVPDCDDSQTINFSTFSNPLFDDSTSSDDESSHEEDSDSLREEIDIFPGPDDSIPPGIESDDFDSEGDTNSTSLPEFESFHVVTDSEIHPLMWAESFPAVPESRDDS